MAKLDLGVIILLLFVMFVLSLVGGLKLWSIYKDNKSRYVGITLIIFMASFLASIFILMPILLLKVYVFDIYNFYAYFLAIMISPIAIMSLYFWVFYNIKGVKFAWVYLVLAVIFLVITLFYMVLLIRTFLSL